VQAARDRLVLQQEGLRIDLVIDRSTEENSTE